MKPLKLYIEGLQSFIQMQEIDFETLTASGLFGISGNTGSGKSTILDAIMICLYGDAGKKREQRDFINIRTNKAYLKLVFESSKEIYTVERTFRIRKGGSMDNSAFLYKRTAEGELTLADNIKNTDSELEKIVGLSTEEFRKCVILPQGEFASFIKSTRSERLKIIGSLFDLEQYGDSLYEKITAKKYEAERKKENAQSAVNAIGDFQPSEIEDTETETNRLKNEVKSVSALINALTQKIKHTEKEIENYNRFSEAEKAYNNLLLKKPQYNKDKEETELIIRASAIIPLLNDHKELKNSLSDTDCKLRQCLLELNTRQALYKKATDDKINAENIFQKNGGTLNERIIMLSSMLSQAKELEEKTETQKRLREEYRTLNSELKNLQGEKEKIESKKAEISKKIECEENVNNIENMLKKSFAEGELYNISQTIDYLKTDFKKALPHFSELQNDKAKEIEKYDSYGDLKTGLTELKELREDLKKAETALNSATEKENALNIKIAGVINLGGSINAEIDGLLKKFGEYGIKEDITENRLANQISILKNEYDKLKEANESSIKNCENLLKRLTGAESEINKYTGLKTETERQIALKDTALSSALKENNFENAESLLALNTDKNYLNSLKNKVSTFEKEYSHAEQDYLRLKEFSVSPDFDNYNKILEDYKKQNEIYQEYIKAIAINEKHLEVLKENKIKLDGYKKEIAEQLKLLNNLTVLQNLVKGKSFMEFAAEEYILEITAQASRHTSHFTGGRFALLYKNGTFLVQDNYNGGELRSTNTLSGGETFLISLSLAVSLSESIVRMSDKPVEFFFLDEGFGTLDKELCDTVMNTIEKLKQTHFVIGVISHVPELMHRLPCRLEVLSPSEEKGSTVKLLC